MTWITKIINNFNIILDDYHIPPESILKAIVKKKNKKLGWERRYLAFGLTQVIIARDSAFHKILNIIPLTAGTYAVKRKAEQLLLKTSEREFIFK